MIFNNRNWGFDQKKFKDLVNFLAIRLGIQNADIKSYF